MRTLEQYSHTKTHTNSIVMLYLGRGGRTSARSPDMGAGPLRLHKQHRDHAFGGNKYLCCRFIPLSSLSCAGNCRQPGQGPDAAKFPRVEVRSGDRACLPMGLGCGERLCAQVTGTCGLGAVFGKRRTSPNIHLPLVMSPSSS